MMSFFNHFKFEIDKDESLKEIFNYFEKKYKSDIDEERLENETDDDGDDRKNTSDFNIKDFEEFMNSFNPYDYKDDPKIKEAVKRGPEALNEYLWELFQKQNNQGEFNTDSSYKKPRKKSKKQLDKEQQKILLEQEKENLKNKSLKSIYIGLAKLLHPDRYLDEEEKLKNEELMKKVTVAYNNKDIFTLLKLEMEFIKKEEKTIENLPESTLIIYNEFLKEQIIEIENNIFSIIDALVYSGIISPTTYNLLNIKTELNYILSHKNKTINIINQNRRYYNSFLQTKNTFTSYKKIINDLFKDIQHIY